MGGAKQNAVYEAKLKAQKLLNKANQAAKKTMKDARRIFIAKVKKATAKYLANIKASKAKIQGSFGEESLVLLQLDESRPMAIAASAHVAVRHALAEWKAAYLSA